MAKLLEDYEPVVKDDGLNTNKNVAIGGNLSVAGTTTMTGGTLGNVVSGSGATVTLTGSQSGSTVLMDRAAGIVFTLPAATPGRNFIFVTTVSVTTNSYKVITAGDSFLIGAVDSIDTDSTNALAAWTGNGSTHVAVTQAAASTNATGGLQGSQVNFRCVTTGLWQVSGTTLAAGTPATPFATS